ncbi:hypothetical protein PanWU01x14_189910, partial [Parasponia andersonii]
MSAVPPSPSSSSVFCLDGDPPDAAECQRDNDSDGALCPVCHLQYAYRLGGGLLRLQACSHPQEELLSHLLSPAAARSPHLLGAATVGQTLGLSCQALRRRRGVVLPLGKRGILPDPLSLLAE